MKLVILVPSADFKGNAGARIRYGRLADALGDQGIAVSLIEIGLFDPLTADCDWAVISKCYDARALVAAAALSNRGTRVGVDLFDDYFSQISDSRLIRLRSWLAQMLAISDFALCSTPVLARIVARYRRDIPVHLVNDPAPAFDRDQLISTLADKAAEAASDDMLRLCWFGVGDNPYFQVGLSDLAAMSAALAQLASSGRALDFTVLTNRRALTGAGLAMLSSLPLAVRVEEWSERREAEVLRDSHACLLPVNAQGYSVAKSPNRAVTALTAGCQVLSIGYPLYAALGDFIYRDVEAFLTDLRHGEPRLSPKSVDAFSKKISEIASAERESVALAAFLKSVPAAHPHGKTAGPIFVIHGHEANQSAHELTRAAGGVSVASPFCRTPLDFDIVVKLTQAGNAILLVSDRLRPEVKAEWRDSAVLAPKVGGQKLWRIAPVQSDERGRDHDALSLPLELALYGPVIENISKLLRDVFCPARIVLAENSQLPLQAAV